MTKLITLFVSALALTTSHAFAGPAETATETPVKSPELTEIEAVSTPLNKEAIIAKLEQAAANENVDQDTAPEASEE